MRYPPRFTTHEQARRAADRSCEARRSGRRRRIDPTTCEIDYDADELEFLRAMDRYRCENHRPFPTLKETLEVLRSLGYRKVN